MKSNLLSLTVAALLCCSPFAASARDTGRAVGAQFDSSILTAPSKIEFKPIERSNQPAFHAGSAIGANECLWQVLNIPVRIGATRIKSNKKDLIPNYVPAMTFHVYVLVDAKNAADKDGRPLEQKKRATMLEKEITYVNIPLKKAQSETVGDRKVDALADINVGVFLSPYDVHCITDDDTKDFEKPEGNKSQPEIKILALAMEAKYNDAACWCRPKSAKEDDIKVRAEAKSWLADNWWKRPNTNTRGARLRSIDETPYASQYYPTYCAIKPQRSGSSSPTETPSILGAADATASDTASTSTTPDATDTTDTTGDDTTTSDTTSGRKSRKSRSSRN